MWLQQAASAGKGWANIGKAHAPLQLATAISVARSHAHLQLATAISAADHANHRAAPQVPWVAHSPCSAACAASCAVASMACCRPPCLRTALGWTAGQLAAAWSSRPQHHPALHEPAGRQVGGRDSYCAGWAGRKETGWLAGPTVPSPRSPCRPQRAHSKPPTAQHRSAPRPLSTWTVVQHHEWWSNTLRFIVHLYHHLHLPIEVLQKQWQKVRHKD